MSAVQSYLKDQLNDQQFAAATAVDSHSLILAGAGSGKTRTLTYKIANLIYGHDVHPQNILAVTFTNKAANEIKERIHHIAHEISSHLSGASTPADDAPVDFDALLSGEAPSGGDVPTFQPHDFTWMGTFHSIFLKILKQDIDKLDIGYTKGFTIYDASGDVPALIKSLLKKKDMTDRLEWRDVQRTISRRKSKGRLPEQAGLHCEDQKEERILEIYTLYQNALKDANSLDFDDLLLLPKLLFDTHPEVLQKWQNQFKHILVDEAQDTNAIQFALMRKLCGPGSTITFIGDDYQSIYRRRGAEMDNFLNVDQRWKEIQTFKLEMNYRSKPHIVAAGNAIIKNNKKQYDKTVAAHREGSESIRIFGFADETDEAIQVIELITKLKEEQDKSRGEFTILYRTNAQSSPFEQILITEGIPYKIVGAFKFFDRVEIKTLLSYIRFVLNPQDPIALKRIINTPSRKIGKTTIESLEDVGNDHNTNLAHVVMHIDQYATNIKPAVSQKISSFRNFMNSILHSMDMFTPAQLLQHIVSGANFKDYYLKLDGEEKATERMENIGQLINMATKYESTGKATVEQFMEEVALLSSLDDTEADADAIKLMSVHASKGLEFPYVFIVGCEENIFPLPKAKFDDAELEEERRGMYVAITRAKDHLFLSYASSRKQRGQIKYNQPSRFLEELPADLVKNYDLARSAGNNVMAQFSE